MKIVKQYQNRSLDIPFFLLLGFVLIGGSAAQAQLKEGEAFKKQKEVKAAVIVSEKPDNKKEYEIIENEADQYKGSPRIIIIRENQNNQAQNNQAQNVLAAATEKSFGQKLSEKIDTSLAKARAEKEAELARIERAQQESILRRIDMALKGISYEKSPAWVPTEEKEEVKETEVKKPSYSSLVEQEGILQARLDKKKPSSGKQNITFSPTIGISDIQGNDYSYNEVESGNTYGIAMDFPIGEGLYSSFSYAYTKLNIPSKRHGNSNSSRNMAYKQNVFSLGLKYKLFDGYFGFRPVLGAGVSYVRGYINQDDNNGYVNITSKDYIVSAFTGYVSGGMEMRLSDSVGIGALLSYHTVLHNDKKSNYRYTIGSNSINRAKETIGRDIQDNSFYTISASLLLQF